MKTSGDDVLYTINARDGLTVELYRWAGSIYARLMRGVFIKADSRCQTNPSGQLQDALKWAHQYQ